MQWIQLNKKTLEKRSINTAIIFTFSKMKEYSHKNEMDKHEAKMNCTNRIIRRWHAGTLMTFIMRSRRWWHDAWTSYSTTYTVEAMTNLTRLSIQCATRRMWILYLVYCTLMCNNVQYTIIEKQNKKYKIPLSTAHISLLEYSLSMFSSTFFLTHTVYPHYAIPHVLLLS